MPWTLYRYILRELIKVLLLSTTVLVVVIGFAAAIKPLSDGLLTAMGMVKFVIYSIPTVLGLAMPFAAAFAGTLVFCRLAADNEVLACRASGLSYGMILLPVFTLGLALTMGVFYLSNSIVPRFYMLAQQQVEHDMVNVLVRKIQKKQSVPFHNTVIYADSADDSQTPPKWPGDIQPSRLLILHGVAASKLSKDGEMLRECTAAEADVWFVRVNGQTVVLMHMYDAMVYEALKGTIAFTKETQFTMPPLPNPFKDRLAFLSYREMQDLAAQPEQFDDIRKAKQDLAEAIASEELIRKMEGAIRTSRTGLTLLAPVDGQKYLITAPKVERIKDGIRLSGTATNPVRGESFSGGLPVRRFEAASATATIGVEESDPEPLVKMDLLQATISDPRGIAKGTQHSKLSLLRSRWPTPLLAPLMADSTDGLAAVGRSLNPMVPPVRSGVENLVLSKVKLGRKIVAKLHERAASAVSCIWVLLLGAVLSMQLKGQMPLVVYFWSFLLATVAVVIVRTGENVASAPSHTMMAGGLIIWMGNIMLIAAIAAVALKLSRN